MRRLPGRAATVVGASYALARVVPLIGTNKLILGDSNDYIRVASRGWFSGQFWAGTRPLLYPLALKLAFRQQSPVLIGQVVISIVAWSALAWVVYTRTCTRWLAALGGLAILACSLSSTIVQW